MVFQSEISIQSHQRSHWIDITFEVQKIVDSSGIKNGICTVNSLHTTGAITINENADPDVEADFFKKLSELIPREPYFRHCEGNSDSHLKTSLVGLSIQIPITHGTLIRGTWQSIYFCEFDGPRNRKVAITIIGE